MNPHCSQYCFSTVARPPEIEHNDVGIVAFTTWYLQQAISPQGASNLLCGSIFPVIIFPSLNVLFVLAELVWSVKVNALGVYVGRSLRHYLEVVNHCGSYFNIGNMLDLRDSNLYIESKQTLLQDINVTLSFMQSGLFHVYGEAARSVFWSLLCFKLYTWYRFV